MELLLVSKSRQYSRERSDRCKDKSAKHKVAPSAPSTVKWFARVDAWDSSSPTKEKDRSFLSPSQSSSTIAKAVTWLEGVGGRGGRERSGARLV